MIDSICLKTYICLKALSIRQINQVSKQRLSIRTQGCHGQGKIAGKLIFFHVREKSGNFLDDQGNLERTWEVREFENKWLQKIYLFCSRGERIYFL